METKKCSKCGELKTLSEYWAKRHACKVCLAAQNRAHRIANKPSNVERQKAYYEKNKLRIRASVKAYREANKERIAYLAARAAILAAQKLGVKSLALPYFCTGYGNLSVEESRMQIEEAIAEVAA